MERDLQRAHEVALGYAPGAARVVCLVSACYGDGPEPQSPLLEEVGDGWPDAGLVHDQLGRLAPHLRAVELVARELWPPHQSGHTLSYVRVERAQGVALEVP